MISKDNEDLKKTVKDADRAINREDFDALMDFYSDDAVLVVKPGLLARGKSEIRRAFEAIADYFNHSLVVTQDEMAILESGDTALVIARALLSADMKTESAFSMERTSTYVFKKDTGGRWRCIIDNSYGAELLENVKD